VHYKDVKAILSPKNGMNLYRGCTHGCIYCDSRSKCYGMEHDFEDVEIKRNAPELLEAALLRKRARCMIGTGAMCDPYLPLEETERLTRRCLELIDKYDFGFSVITKSDRVLRDLDLLKRINEKTKCVVQMTLTTYDEDLCRIIEPHVASTKERYEALKALQKERIPTVVWLSPILPFINDTKENLEGILNYCFDAGVKGILCFGMGLTLREGNREYFYEKLDTHFPGMKGRYIAAFGDSYVCQSPASDKLMGVFATKCRQRGVLYRPDEVFAYLNEFEDKCQAQQLTLFE
jgi:DNA repair photolyase